MLRRMEKKYVRRKKQRKSSSPQVIEFVDPATTIRNEKRKERNRKRKRFGGDSDALREERRGKDDRAPTTKETWKSIRALGAVGLTGKAKWQYKQELIRKIGGKAPKNRKVPLKILVGMREKEKKRRLWRENEIKRSKVVVASSTFHNDGSKTRTKDRKRRSNKNDILRPSFGHFRGGTLFLGKKDF